MAFCPNCGAKVNGRFCASCGASVGAAGTDPATPVHPTVRSGPQELSGNAAAALCYGLGPLTGVYFLAQPPYNAKQEIRFHAWQSILALGGIFALYAVLSSIYVVLPFVLWRLLSTVLMLLQPVGFLLWVYLMYQAFHGTKVVLPWVGPMAEERSRKPL